MNPDKPSSVISWPHPMRLHSIQHCLGLANYYWEFSPHYSTLVAPITKKDFKAWTSQPEEAFFHLKRAFSQCCVTLIFLAGDGRILHGSWGSTFPKKWGKILTCGFFSRTFSLVERNYSHGDQELPVIKLALDVWCHLLKRSALCNYNLYRS